MLNLTKYSGPDDQPPLLVAHGLFGSARNWGVIAKRLSVHRSVYCVDMRNHGNSFHAASNSYHDMADDLAKVIDGTWDVLGHSMGGKSAMVLALCNPEKVNRLIVADIAPVGYGHTQLPMIEAMRSVDLDHVRTRGDADQQLAKTIDDRGIRAFLLQSLDVREKKWNLNLEVLAAEMDSIIGFPSVDGVFDGPTFFLSGAMSDYVQSKDRPIIKQHFPKARFAKIPGAGHWLHAEKPREFEASIRAFLDR